MPADIYRGTIYPTRRRRRAALRTAVVLVTLAGMLYAATTIGIGG